MERCERGMASLSSLVNHEHLQAHVSRKVLTYLSQPTMHHIPSDPPVLSHHLSGFKESKHQGTLFPVFVAGRWYELPLDF